MTKMIRVENADNSHYKVRAFVEELVDGEWVRDPKPVYLDYPTHLAELYIHSTRRVVVEEYE